MDEKQTRTVRLSMDLPKDYMELRKRFSSEQSTARHFYNGHYEWVSKGGPVDKFGLASSYKLHEFMLKKYAITNCPNCGAPYNGNDQCEYCGSDLKLYRISREYFDGEERQ